MSKGYTVADAGKDTGVSSRETAAAQHEARNDAYGSKESGRDYGSNGDRGTWGNYSQAYEIGKDHGLYGGKDSSSGGGEGGGSGK